MSVCPYCHRDEHGKPVTMDSAVVEAAFSEREFAADLKDLASEDPFVRDQAVARVVRHGAAIVPALLGVLSDFAKPGLSGIAQALGRIADPRAIPALAQAAKMGDEELRLSAVVALAQFHEPEVLPILLTEAERPHPIIQSYLANILGTFQDNRIVPVLAKLAGHPNREVSFQAACALGESGDHLSIGVLKNTWRYGDVLVRSACAASLRKLGSKPTVISRTMLVVGVLVLALVGAGVGYVFYR
jgi:HEAT repeat protein